jgi:hypothetical protein
MADQTYPDPVVSRRLCPQLETKCSDERNTGGANNIGVRPSRASTVGGSWFPSDGTTCQKFCINFAIVNIYRSNAAMRVIMKSLIWKT